MVCSSDSLQMKMLPDAQQSAMHGPLAVSVGQCRIFLTTSVRALAA